MRKVKLAVARYLFFLAIQLRLYTNWSRLHRYLFDGVAKNTTLPTFTTVEEVGWYIRGFSWRPDSWIDLGDAICSPEMVWYRYLNGIQGAGDCDEFAVFLANVIEKSIEAGTWRSSISDPDILTVTWMNPDGSLSGHIVCLLQFVRTEAPWSYGYMDYDLPRWCGTSENDAAQAVLRRYAPGGELIGWAVHSPKLKKRSVYLP